jgi:hypothetical protein
VGHFEVGATTFHAAGYALSPRGRP